MAPSPHGPAKWAERKAGSRPVSTPAVPGDLTSNADVRRHVLPDATPVLPGMVVTARTDQRSRGGPGGDWFESVAMPEGRLGLAVGDVIGTGLGAAAAMAQLRAVAAEALLSGCLPEEVLVRLDRLAAHVGAAHGSSAVVIVLEPEGGLTVAHRGHPPPLAVSATGSVRVLPVGPAAPLGLGGESASATEQLDRGDLLVAYTDGALPPWSPATGDGVEGLRRSCAEAAARALAAEPYPDRDRDEGGRWGLAGPDSPLFALTPRTAADDETTVVTVEIRPAPDSLVGFVGPLDPPTPGGEPLQQWLVALGARNDDVFALHEAVAEVLSCLHQDGHLPVAGHGHPHRAHLEASLGRDGRITVGVFPTVEPGNDLERAARVRSVDRARSLISMLGLVDHADVALRDDVAGLVLHHALRRTVCFNPQRGNREAAYHGLDVRAVRRRAGIRTLAVRGAVDRNSAEDLRLAIAAAERSGRRLVVDLNEVTVLGSAGVRLLHDAVARGRTQLVARSGSAAGAVMRRVALPFADEGGMGSPAR